MEFYILKSGICLAIFYGFYKLVLEKESFHVFKRFYLLSSVVLAFVIPLITFTEYIEVIPQEVPLFFPESSITHTVIEAEPINYIPIMLWSIYGLGVLLFSFKFLKNLSGIIFRIKRNPKFKNQSFINVLLQDLVIPHTFFSYIFLNKHKFETQQIPKEVLLHEETHAKQKHSLDVLFIEILQILFWFNPIIFFIKHSIKLNHEFLADHAVLKQGIASSTYQNILLAFSSPDSNRGATEPQLANAINYSSIKKRFTVMKTHTSKKAFWLRSLILLPLLAILIYSFSEKKVVEKPFVAQQNISANGVTETMMKEYRDFINEIESSNRIIYPKYLRAVAIYDLMTEEQRNTVKKYPENIVSNLSNVKPKTPTESEFNSWKDSNKFAIWIDGNHVKNSELNNYKASDIKYFANSFVHNNARSEKFPQPYQNHLYTQQGFDTAFTNSEKDHSALEQIKKELLMGASQEEIEEYNNLIKQFNSRPEKERIIRVKDKNRIEYIFGLMTNEQKKENESFPDFLTVAQSPIPYNATKNLENYIIERNKVTDYVSKNIANYPYGYVELSESEQKEFMKLYNAMSSAYLKLSEQEKKSASKMLVPPPDPKQYNLVNGKLIKKDYGSKNQQKATPKEIKEYNDLIKKFTTYKKEKQIYSLEDLNRSSVIFEKMSTEQKATVDDVPVMPPSPMPPVPPLPKTVSKELTEAKKKFDEKSTAYYELVSAYFAGKKVNSKELWLLYDESMNLYNKYIDLNNKESESSRD